MSVIRTYDTPGEVAELVRGLAPADARAVGRLAEMDSRYRRDHAARTTTIVADPAEYADTFELWGAHRVRRARP